MLGRSQLERALQALGEVLEARGLGYHVVVAGGSGLLLLDLSIRPTEDLDVIAIEVDRDYTKARPLPPKLVEAVAQVGDAFALRPAWLNAGPADLIDFGLPAGFESRVSPRSFGPLQVDVAGRLDQVFFKLYAAVDQGPESKHFRDLVSLRPTSEELVAAGRWARSHDPSPGFEQELRGALRALRFDDAADQL